MTPLEMFQEVEGGDDWTTGALDTQWKVKEGVLYLQATKSNFDWFMDCLVKSVPARPFKDMGEPYKAHLGFTALYDANAEVLQALDFHAVVGYSLGAALGLRVHEDRLFRTGKAPDETHLFGCPASYKGLTDSLRKRWAGVVCYDNPRDLVTKCLTWIGYQHVGTHVTLGGKPKRPSDVSWLSWISGHSNSEYQQRLAAL